MASRCCKEGKGLNPRKHRGSFGDDGNFLYLDHVGS